MFYPGETIVHEFVIPFAKTLSNNRPNIDKVYVTYKQNNKIVLTKTITTLSAITNNGFYNVITGTPMCIGTVELTQKETLLFDESSNYTIQLNVLFSNGTRAASDEMTRTAIRVACDEINNYTGVQHYKDVINNE